jgi:hypothetical protein
VLLAQRDLSGAERLVAYQSALFLAQTNPDTYLDVALAYWDLGKYDLICQMLDQGLRADLSHSVLQSLCTECTR